MRIDQYGWTEFRVMRAIAVAALAALAAAAAWQLLRRRAFALHVVPIALAIVFVLAAAGPWSAPAISRRSQVRRLDAALASARVTGEITAAQRANPRTIPAELYDQIQGSAHYLLGHFGRESLPDAIARHVRSTDQGVEIGGMLALVRAPSTDARTTQFGFGSLPHGVRLSTGSADVYRIDFPWRTGPDGPPRDAVMAVGQDSMRLQLNLNHELLTAALEPLLALRGSERMRRPQPTDPQLLLLPLIGADGTRRGDLLLLDVSLDFDSAVMKVQRFSGIVLLPRAR
jgi:hypothetical protein